MWLINRQWSYWMVVQLSVWQGICALYFTQNTYKRTLTSLSFTPDQIVVRLHALHDMRLMDPDSDIGTVQYSLNNATFTKDGNNNAELTDWWQRNRDSIFSLDNGGLLTVTHAPVQKYIEQFDDDAVLYVNVEAQPASKDTALSAKSRIELKLKTVTSLSCDLSNSNNLLLACFGGQTYDFDVMENSGHVTFGTLPVEQFRRECPNMDVSYVVENSDQRTTFLVNTTTGCLYFSDSLDREQGRKLTFNLQCRVSDRRGALVTAETSVTVHILDVDDSPPLIIINRLRLITQHFKTNEKTACYREKEMKCKVSQLVRDNDDIGSDNYVISINDPYNIFKANKRTLSIKSNGSTATNIALIKQNQLPDNVTKHEITITITDINYRPSPAGDSQYNNTIIWTVYLEDRNNSVVMRPTREVSRSAARYARVDNLSGGWMDEGPGTVFSLDSPSAVFAVTPNSGIIYVNSTEHLKNITDKHVTITAKMNDNGNSKRKKIVITITQEDHNCTDETCASNQLESDCNTKCGLGSSDGKCHMRTSGTGRKTTKYSTCSPDLDTCPDEQCDELEEMDVSICPQDCAYNLQGEGDLGPGKRGVAIGAGTCWCELFQGQYKCRCEQDQSAIPTAPTRPSTVSDHVNKSRPTENPATIATASSTQSDTESVDGKPVCDDACKMTLGLVLGCTSVCVLIIITAWRLHNRRKRRNKALKHVGSIGSMNAIPSDYIVEDRDYSVSRVSLRSVDWSIKPLSTNYNSLFDPKWEFPRQNLVLGKTIGEGEFGLVVQAKSYVSSERKDYQTVAVKMVKTAASQSELQDLVSEFNLLKDINHVNVIKLLGACTIHGPLYIIVEYCEHGSLGSFLRNCRLQRAFHVDPNPDDDIDLPDADHRNSVSSGDLLGFVWQIAKGMNYLAETKVVHRDLAARNILLADGKMIKISDFGLSRDVYEADKYTKTSKGRIPVKWMAPESLYDQIYTSKSDVWSYGVVLWEIATLGAIPYPGITPERLFELLKTGYRMNRPENCSDELYAVMQKCWKLEPIDRPAFKQLVNIFDRMLEDNMQYLDLDCYRMSSTAPREDTYGDILMDNQTFIGSQSDKSDLETEPEYGRINMLATDLNSYLTPSAQRSYGHDWSGVMDGSRGKTYPTTTEMVIFSSGHDPVGKRVTLESASESDGYSSAKESDLLQSTRT